MNYLFTNAPLLVARHDKEAYKAHYAEDLERRALEIQEKTNVVDQREDIGQNEI
jgi:hypothetical protein